VLRGPSFALAFVFLFAKVKLEPAPRFVRRALCLLYALGIMILWLVTTRSSHKFWRISLKSIGILATSFFVLLGALCFTTRNVPSTAVHFSSSATPAATVHAPDDGFFGITADPRVDPGQYLPIAALGKCIGCAWTYIEDRKGAFDWENLDRYVGFAQQHGIPMIFDFLGVPKWAARPGAECSFGCAGPPAQLSDITDYARAVATRYKGRIQWYELWNEPNNSPFWAGTVADLGRQSRAIYETIHAIDPQAKFITPGVAVGTNTQKMLSEFDAYFAAGGGFEDAVGLHSYPLKNDCEKDALDCAGQPLVNQVKSISLVAAKLGKPVIITEGGWGPDEDLPKGERAAFAARWLILARSAGVKYAVWFAFQRSGRPSDSWGTIWNGSTLDPAGIACKTVAEWLEGKKVACSSGDGAWSCTLSGGGKSALIVWGASGKKVTEFNAKGYSQVIDLNGNTSPISGTITLSQTPVLLQ